jgi:hypothetical protein
MKKTCLFIFFCCTLSLIFSQRALNQDFTFADGLYQEIDEFKKDAPSHFWRDYEGIWTYNPRMKCYQVEKIYRKGKPEYNLQDSIWGFTIKGIPYIKISPDSSGRPLTLFTEISVRGLINIFSYEKENQELIPMKAYNPLTGTVFRKGVIKRNSTTLEKRMLFLDEGIVLPLNTVTLEQKMERDKDIVRALRLATDEEYEEKLIRALIVFNARYPFIIQK